MTREAASRIVVPALVFCLTLALYLQTLTEVHTFDALSYVLDIDRKPLAELFHPHHLAYGPFGLLVRSIAHGLGLTGSARVPLQVANALAGAGGVALFYGLTYASTRQADLAAVGALLLGASYAFWYYAVEVEVYTIAGLFLIGALWLMLRLLREPSLGLACGLGALQGLAVLFHQTNVLLSLPSLATLMICLWRPTASSHTLRSGATDKKGRAAYWLLGAYLLPLGLIVGGAYLWVGLGVSGFRSWDELYGWLAGYATTGWWGGAIDSDKLMRLGKGLSEALAQPSGMICGIALLAALALNWRGLAQWPREGLMLGSWLLGYGAFFLWWEPDNIEFWIASLPPFYLLLVLSICGRQWNMRSQLWAAAVAVIGVVMLGMNWGAITRRGDAATDLQRRIARELAAQSVPGDLLLVPDGLQELYLPYYEGRVNSFSLNQALFATSGDWPAACGLIRERVETTLASGLGVLLANEALRPMPAALGAPPTLLERFGLRPDEVTSCYTPYAAGLEPVTLGADLPTYHKLPSAQELADGLGWDFSKGRWGWRIMNATEESGKPSLTLVPEIDPVLSSPPLRIDLSRVRAIEIQMAASTAARDAQLFLLDDQGHADEARALRWTLAPGPEIQTYLLDLAGLADKGLVAGLRLDPVSQGDGSTVRVLWIRLVQ